MVLINKSCKVLPFILHANKTYIAKMKLGVKTDTGDIWGNPIKENDHKIIIEEEVIKVLASFIGDQMQKPPMTSAIKIDGKKLLFYQKEGIEIEVPERPINISSIKLLSITDEIEFEVTCSAGTYVRSLCEDIAERLGSIGTMTSLIRTKIDEFSIDDAYTLEDISNGNYKGFSNYEILSKYYETYETNDINHVKDGKKIRINSNQQQVLVTCSKQALAIYERVEDYLYKSKRGLF